MVNERRALLPSDRNAHTHSVLGSFGVSARGQTKRYLTSKTGHYSVLALVSVDITAIFSDLILQLLVRIVSELLW